MIDVHNSGSDVNARGARNEWACAGCRRHRHQRRNVAQRLLVDGWQVIGVARHPERLDERISPLTADLEDAEAVAAAVGGTSPTHVFFTTWSRHSTESENCDVNGRMLQNLLAATGAGALGPPRRARDRPEALSRAVRGVREGSARHPVLRGSSPTAVRATSTTSRRTTSPPPSATGLPGGSSAAHAHRLGARQCDEHGGDACRLRGYLPRNRSRISLSGLARAVGAGDGRHGRGSSR